MNLDPRIKELYKLGLAYLVCHSIGRMSRQMQKFAYISLRICGRSRSRLFCTHALLLHALLFDYVLLLKPRCWITVAPLISAWQSGSQVSVSLATMNALFLQALGHTLSLSLTSKLSFWSLVRWLLHPQQGNGLPMLNTAECASAAAILLILEATTYLAVTWITPVVSNSTRSSGCHFLLFARCSREGIGHVHRDLDNKNTYYF